jgi:RND family efflux transporter MFP subunit
MRTSRALALVTLVSALAVAGCGKPPGELPPPEPPTVGTVKPQVVDFAPTKEFTGRLVTKDPVKVIPQVTGKLVSREFKDGDYVEAEKTVLFRIDPVLYKADAEKAKADQAKAKADIANWLAQIDRDKAEYTRIKAQVDGGAGSRTDLDKAQANVKVSEAQWEVSKANKDAADATLAKAEESLKYCTILAPTSGRVGQALVSTGTLVDAYKSELVTVYPVDPVYAVWEVDELTSLWYRDQIRAGAIKDSNNPATPLMCTIKQKDEKDFTKDASDKSRNAPVDYYDPFLERGTGTRTIRATFANPVGKGPKGEALPPLLSAGDSVRVRVSAGAPRKVLAIPEGVTFTQQRRTYVYVVTDGKAQLREVEPQATFNGMVEVNRRASATAPSGLDESDVVIADNLLRVRPGVPVTVKSGQ